MLHGSIFEREMQKAPEDINCLDYKEYPLVDESEFIQIVVLLMAVIIFLIHMPIIFTDVLPICQTEWAEKSY